MDLRESSPKDRVGLERYFSSWCSVKKHSRELLMHLLIAFSAALSLSGTPGIKMNEPGLSRRDFGERALLAEREWQLRHIFGVVREYTG